MKLSEFCIKRPVFTVVLSLVLIVIGIIGYSRLSVRQFPDVDFPVITIATNYPGANANLVESQITNPIEESLTNITGLKYIESTSAQDDSTIRLKFDLGTDLSNAASEVRDKLSMLADTLPKEAHNPVMYRLDSNDFETILLSFSDKNKSMMALTDYITRYIKPQLEQVDGVARVMIFGGRTYAMRLWLNPEKMATQKVTVPDITSALRAQNADIPSGQIKSTNRNYSVITSSKLKSARQFNHLILRKDKNYLIRFGDVGHAKVAPETTDNAVRYDGKQIVTVSIFTQTNANPITVADNVTKKIKSIQNSLPEGMLAKVVFNASQFVHASLHNVYRAVIEAIFLVLLVVFLFLGSIRATTVPIATIPICMIAIFAFLYAMGYTINSITLLAIVLAIGLVVDDAIVMLENVHRHVELGKKPFAAAITASREIGFVIVAMTITLAAVYAPIAFTPGMLGVIFRRFAFTLAGTVIISGFIALTLSPMMCARLVRKSENRYTVWLENLFSQIVNSYKKLLAAVLKHRKIIIIVLLTIILAGYLLYRSFAAELSPEEDQGVFMTAITAPTNASFDYINGYAKEIEKIFSGIPEETGHLMIVGTGESRAFTTLMPWAKRKRTQAQITAQVNKKLQKVPGVHAFAIKRSGLGGGGKHGDALEFVLMTTQSYKNLNTTSQNLVKIIKKWPGFGVIDNNLKMDSEQFNIKINRDLAANLKVNMDDIASTLSTMLGGSEVTRFDVQGQGYNVILQLPRKSRRNIDIIGKLYVRNTLGKMIPLSSLVTISSSVGPVALPHYDRMRSAKIIAQLNAGYKMSDAISFVKVTMKKYLPDDYKYSFAGAAKRYLETSNQMAMVFALAIIFIYLVLGAQFESFIDPFIILFTVPLSIIGALFTLRVTGGSLNIFSNIGFVTLIGLISKHGILITEFANQLRAQGKELHQAIIEAAAIRLRPILMTTAAMSIGALPLALATGAGAMERQQIGWVIVGGLLFGTFFSLFVVPVAYSYFGKWRKITRENGPLS